MSRIATTQEKFCGPNTHMNGTTQMRPSHDIQGVAFTQPQGGETVQQGPVRAHLRDNRAVAWIDRIERMHEGSSYGAGSIPTNSQAEAPANENLVTAKDE